MPTQGERERSQAQFLERVQGPNRACQTCAKGGTPLVALTPTTSFNAASQQFSQLHLVLPSGSRLQMSDLTKVMQELGIPGRYAP